MVNNQNINITSTTTTVSSEINSNYSSNEQIIILQNPDSASLPTSSNVLENELIQVLNESESLESIRNQLVNNITLRLPESNMDLFPGFVADITDQQREVLYSILTESTIVNNYQPALLILAIFTNYNGLINLDLILSDMTSTVLELMHSNNSTVVPTLFTETVAAAPINEITDSTIVNVGEIVVRNNSEIDNLNRNFINDLIQRSTSAIQRVRINEFLNRVYRFFLSQPQAVLAILQIINNRARNGSINGSSLENNNQNESLRGILISIYDWLSDLGRPAPRT